MTASMDLLEEDEENVAFNQSLCVAQTRHPRYPLIGLVMTIDIDRRAPSRARAKMTKNTRPPRVESGRD
jgi:hypothetical protein